MGGQAQIICGPDYVGEAELSAGRLALQTEQNGLTGPDPRRELCVYGGQANRTCQDAHTGQTHGLGDPARTRAVAG